MSFRRGNQLDERRRRLLSESRFDGTARVGARSGGRRSPDTADRSRNYGDASFLDEQLRLTDLAPRRLSVLLLIFVVGVGIIVGLEALYIWMPRIAATTSDGSVATFDLDDEGSLAVWFSSITLTLAAAMAVIVFSVRRYKKDDYRGHYRIWLWAACCWLLMSIDETASLHEGFKEMMTWLTGARLQGDGSLWWVAAYVFLLGAIGVRLLLDMRQCRLSAGSFLAGGGCYVLAVVVQLQWILPESGARGIMVEEGAEMLGNLFILLAMALHARFVILDAQGLLPPRRRWTSRNDEEGIDDEYSYDDDDEADDYEDDVGGRRPPIKVHPPHGVPRPNSRSATEAQLLARAAQADARAAQRAADEAEREEELPAAPVTRRLTKQEKKALRRRLRKQQEKRAGG